MILDLGLPDGNGIEFIRDFRGWSQVPIIVLSARTGEIDKIEALDAGADDYLTKPFGVGELLARVRATRRRRGGPAETAEPFRIGDVEVDLVRRVVRKGNAPLHLTPIEFRLLALLINNAGRVLTHRQILREVWGPAHVEHEHYVRVHMGHLRRKVEDDPAQPRYLVTETAVGYRLSPDLMRRTSYDAPRASAVRSPPHSPRRRLPLRRRHQRTTTRRPSPAGARSGCLRP